MREYDKTETGMRLRSLRLEHGYMVKDIAERIGVTGSAVTQWETSGLSPRVDHMVMLSEIYGVPLDLLVARKAV